MPKKPTQSNQVKTPKLRFPGFSGVWEDKKIKEITTSVDYRGKGPEKTDSGVFLVTAKNIKKGYIDYETSKEYVPFEKYNEIMKKGKPEIGDILITTEAPLGNVAQVDNKDIALAQRVIKFRVKSLSENQFIKYIFLSNKFQTELNRRAIGTTVQGISGADLHKIKIKIPSLPEQQKIASFLGSVDEWIANLRAQHAELASYKKGMMQKIFSREMRFKDDKGNDFPEWEEKRLGEMEDQGLIKLGRGEVISKINIQEYPGNHPIYSSSVQNDGLFGKYGKYNFDEELISWSVDGGGHFFYRPKHKFSITNVSGWMKVIDSKILNTRFLAIQLQLLHEKEKFDYTVKAHPSVIRGIYKLQIPSLPEQQKIVDLFSGLDDLIDSKKVQIESAENWKKGIMQNLFV